MNEARALCLLVKLKILNNNQILFQIVKPESTAMKQHILTFLILCLLISCSKNPETNETPDNATLKAALVKSNNSFAIDIFKEILSNDPVDENIFISPLSMYYALSMAGTGAEAKTKQEFINLLGWENKSDDEILASMKELYNDLLPQASGVNLEIANSLWSRQGATIKDIYKNQVQDYFDAEVRELDFSSPEAVDIINSWIEVKTNNKIEDMLDFIPSNALLYLINAVYFKANWKYIFEEKNTFNAAFRETNGTMKNVDFMQQKFEFWKDHLYFFHFKLCVPVIPVFLR